MTVTEHETASAKIPAISNRMHLRHVPALDGLRGAAVAGVVLFHGGHLTGGYLGVDLFFVLSGFLITSLLVTESGNTGRIRLGSFWARRARRLLPALGGLMVGIAVYYVVWADPTELERIRGDAVATVGYFANWRDVFSGNDYWAIFAAPSPLDHTWSLAIEEQFYLVWPLVFVGALKLWKDRARQALFVIAIAFAIVSTALMFALYDPLDSVRVYYGTDTRATGILLGAALAIWCSMRGPVRSRAARVAVEVLAIVAAVVLFLMWTRLDGQSGNLYRGGFVLAGLCAIAIIAAAWQPTRGPVATALSFRPLCWLGLISYGVYLWHWPVDLVVSADRTGITGWPLFTLQSLVTLSIALVSYQFLEMPIRRGALTKRQWQVAVPVLAAVGALGLFVASATAPSGAFTFRLARWADPPRVRPVSADVTTRVGKVIIVGDSVALSMASGLRNAGLDTFPSGYPGCHVVRGEIDTPDVSLRKQDCRWPTFWTRQIEKSQARTVIVTTGGFELYDVKPPGASEWLVPGTSSWARYFRGELQDMVDTLSATGARVVVTNYPCAKAPERTPDELENIGLFNDRRRKAANRVLAEVAAANPDRMRLLDLDRFLCPSGEYQSGLRSVGTMRIDGVHFTQRGSNVVGRWIAHQLLRDAPAVPPAVPPPTAPPASG